MTSSANAAKIVSVSGHDRPMWSVLIPVYNCARYLEETLAGVLSQDPGETVMEIIVIDDCSSDDPGEVVERLAGSRARFIRQTENVGKIRNYETGLNESRGILIHQLHGDDRVRPGFYRSMELAFNSYPDAAAFFCRSAYIDETGAVTGETGVERHDVGLLEHWLETIFVSQRIQTPSMVVKRQVYETLGGFDRRLDAFEDWEMWIRVACSYEMGFIPDILAEYRISASNSTSRTARSGSHADILRQAMGIVDAYVPAEIVARQRAARNREQAQYFLHLIPQMVRTKDYRGLMRTWIDALSFSRDPRTLYRMMTYTVRSKLLRATD
jgi:glycosyltransferase involved in cell wall biosynthesis